MLENIRNTTTHLAMDQLGETWLVASHHVPDMSSIMWLPWQRLLPSNCALDIQQLWASGGQTREPILLKFGIQQQIRTTMTVTWSNINIFIIQNGGRSLLENIRNAITRLLMDRLGRNLGGRIPSCSQYWKLLLRWDRLGRLMGPSNTSAAKPFHWYWSLLLTAQWTFWFCGV